MKCFFAANRPLYRVLRVTCGCCAPASVDDAVSAASGCWLTEYCELTRVPHDRRGRWICSGGGGHIGWVSVLNCCIFYDEVLLQRWCKYVSRAHTHACVTRIANLCSERQDRIFTSLCIYTCLLALGHNAVRVERRKSLVREYDYDRLCIIYTIVGMPYLTERHYSYKY